MFILPFPLEVISCSFYFPTQLTTCPSKLPSASPSPFLLQAVPLSTYIQLYKLINIRPLSRHCYYVVDAC